MTSMVFIHFNLYSIYDSFNPLPQLLLCQFFSFDYFFFNEFYTTQLFFFFDFPIPKRSAVVYLLQLILYLNEI